MDLTTLKAAFSGFSTDFSKFAADVQAKLTALAANQVNPQDATDIAAIATGLSTLDDQVKQMDASLNPPAPSA